MGIDELCRSGTGLPARTTIGLFGDGVPKTAANFVSLRSGDNGVDKSGKPPHFKDSEFHRIISNFRIQGGGVTSDDRGGESSYEGMFDDETFQRNHAAWGIISKASAGKRHWSAARRHNSQDVVARLEA